MLGDLPGASMGEWLPRDGTRDESSHERESVPCLLRMGECAPLHMLRSVPHRNGAAYARPSRVACPDAIVPVPAIS